MSIADFKGSSVDQGGYRGIVSYEEGLRQEVCLSRDGA